MTKMNKAGTRPRGGTGPMRTEAAPSTHTALGGPGYAKDAKTELFTLAVTNMVGEATYHEAAGARDARYTTLVRDVAVADPAWILGMVGWLRGEANMRTASIVMAAEAVKARLDWNAASTRPAGPVTRKMGGPVQYEEEPIEASNRKIIDVALQRADEPGELLAYWMSTYGRAVPKPVKRGIGDAARRLYTEYSLLKYDTASHAVRFGDVLDLVHPAPATPDQGALFHYALDRRHGRDDAACFADLPMVGEAAELRRLVAAGRYDLLLLTDVLKKAGFTWEDALSLAGNKVHKDELWEALIPTMGYMALLRNLRNFDEAGVSDVVARQVADRLTDPGQVARSRQLPFRFYSAYLAAPSDRWKHPLSVAFDLAMTNVPKLPGRTLVLIDTSGSMTSSRISEKSTVSPAQAAAVLGIALAKALGADVFGWASHPYRYELTKGANALKEVDGFLRLQGYGGHGTNIPAALGAYDKHDRVFLLSDMQTIGAARAGGRHMTSADPGDLIPAHVPLYAVDMQGYRAAGLSTGKPNRHQLAGYTDKLLTMVSALEAGRNGDWPWMIGTEAVRG
jgi:hypothetical protein